MALDEGVYCASMSEERDVKTFLILVHPWTHD